MERNEIKILIFALVCSITLIFSSCRTTRVATKTEALKPMSTNKLIRNMEERVFDYKHLSIKKISCQFDNGKTKISFKANILAEKNKQIVVMLSKLNIPVGRLWLTPDSVKFINYIEKSYFLGDYNYLSSVIDMDIDFATVNAILSNDVFALGNEKKDKELRNYQSHTDSSMYVLESVRKLKPQRENPHMSERRQARKSRKLVSDSPVKQTIYVDPTTFKLRKIELTDSVNSRNLKIDFSDFTPVEKQLFPGEMSLYFNDPDSYVKLDVKFAGLSTEEGKDIRFKVPEKYTRINH